MNNNLYDALENCIQALAQGQDLDFVLTRYPDLAKQLIPLLQASRQSRIMGGRAIPSDVQHRGRTRILQRAAEMREFKRFPRRRMMPMFSRLAITLGLVGGFFLGSTGLVSASSSSLPGDQLYSVKRTWEDVRLLLVFTPGGRDVLQSQYEQERINETSELLTKGRSVSVTFTGLVTGQQNGKWMVSGIPVSITNLTQLPVNTITQGAPVQIVGETHSDGMVDATEIRVLQPGVFLPPLEPSGINDTNGNTDNETQKGQATPDADTSNPKVISTEVAVKTPVSPIQLDTTSTQNQQNTYEFTGVVQSIQRNVWVINGQTVSVDQAQTSDNIVVGSIVKLNGYTDSNGTFIVSQIVLKSSGGGSGADPSGNDNQNNNNNWGNNQNDNHHHHNGD